MSEETVNERGERQSGPRQLRAAMATVLGIVVVGMAVGVAVTEFFQEPALVPVTGRVLYRGKPLPDGFVVTSPLGGGTPALSAFDAEGGFELTTNGISGARVGVHRLAVRAYTRDMPPTPIVPAIYISAETSPLTIVVENGGRNYFEFELDQPSVK